MGRAVRAAYARNKIHAISTSRRSVSNSSNVIYLDLDYALVFDPPACTTRAVIVAAATGYTRCAKDPKAYDINVRRIPELVGNLLGRGISVSLISSNTVFGGLRNLPGEDDRHDPRFAYAIQKDCCEFEATAIARSQGASSLFSVIRLTKVLDWTVPPLPEWIANWSKGMPFQPIIDFKFAPISTRYVGEAILKIVESAIPGNFHVSGASDISYAEFAHLMADRLHVAKSLVQPIAARDSAHDFAFRPRFSRLGMDRTTKLVGLLPQSPEAVVEDLVASLDGSED